MTWTATICRDLPRQRFIHLPTPLETSPRLSGDLGIRLLIKREDLAGLCVGGNKSRLLEFALGTLMDTGVDTLIAYAAPQSNKLRDIAAVAARCGMKAVLLIPQSVSDASHPRQGNRLLFDILGADVRVVPGELEVGGIMSAQDFVREQLERQGYRPAILDRRLDYGIDATVAYVDAAEELHRQLGDRNATPHSVYIAVGAGMTVAGLALGLKHLGSPMRVVGVSTGNSAAQLMPEILHHAKRAAERLGLATRLDDIDLTLLDDPIGAAYGAVTPPLTDAIRRFARLHGLIVDPVYNAKVAFTLIQHAANGKIPKGATAVYINTGGSPAVFGFGAELGGAA